MLKMVQEQWYKNKDHFREVLLEYEGHCSSYESLFELIIKEVINRDSKLFEFDTRKITVVDDGDYQGTQLFLIPMKTYQPSMNEYLMTYIYYGSCSCCDTMQAIQYCSDMGERIDDLYKLALHMCQRMIIPYKTMQECEYDGMECVSI